MFSRRCLFLLLVCATGCQDRIQHGLDERQANELQRVLVERGLDARKVPESGKKPTWAIEVTGEQGSDAVRILAELGLPRPPEDAGCDVFGGGGLVRTPVEEQLCRVRVMEQGLEKTLQTVEGVILARVHLVVPPRRGPGNSRCRRRPRPCCAWRPAMRRGSRANGSGCARCSPEAWRD